MSHLPAHVQDYDPATGNIVIAAGAVDVASGVTLVALSEPIHIAIGVVLIVFGLFLFTWAATPHTLDGERFEACLARGHDASRQPTGDQGQKHG